MLLGVLKEFVGELKRWKEDNIVNATPVKRMALPGSPLHANNSDNEIRWEITTLANVRVGDIIKIDDLEQVPADCVLLKVCDDKAECFVKTSALDGERNLKPKLANAKVSANFDKIFGPKCQQSEVDLSMSCIPPTKELYYFEGRMRATLPNNPDFKISLDLN
jgi:magnesium-transporting ATPase (P-type)